MMIRFVRKLISYPGVRKISIVSLFCILAAAAPSFADIGDSGWPIFKKVQTANTRGITSDSPYYGSLLGLFYNPSLLAAKRQREAFLISESGFIGDKLGGLIYGEPLKKGMLAGGIVGYDAGGIELNWVENGQMYTENASAQKDLLAVVSYGYPYRPNLFLGGSLKMAASEIAGRESAMAIGADVGATYLHSDRLYFSAAVQNLGTSSKFIEKSNPLPLTTYMGAGYATRIKDYHLLSGAGMSYNMIDGKMTPEVGVELRYSLVSLNVGYRFNMHESALQLGLGIRWNNVEFGYSYVPGVYLDATHRMNIGYKFALPSGNKKTVSAAKAPAAATKKTAVTKKTPAQPVKKAPARAPAAISKKAVKTTATK